MSKRALISGITGQDGSYLAELLLDKGYEVHGIVRRASTTNYWRIEHLLDRIQLRPADLLDQLSLIRVIDDVRPHEFYNLAAMSFVPAVLGSADADRRLQLAGRHPRPRGGPAGRFVNSLLPGVIERDVTARSGKFRRREMTPFYPRSPYGVSKVFAHYITVNYRESYNLFAVSRHPLQSRIAASWAANS